ncbi:unnamed protein product [Ixodes pacificus]
MDPELGVFLLDAAFHLISALASAVEFAIYFNQGLGSTGDLFSLTTCGTMFLFHALQLSRKPWTVPGYGFFDAMSLMPLEIVFILGDQAYHLTRAALDLALLVDACVYGVHTVEACVRVVAGLCMLTFHALFLG